MALSGRGAEGPLTPGAVRAKRHAGGESPMRSRASVAVTLLIACALAALSISCGGGNNADLRFANLDGADETPPNSSTATGTAAYKIPDSRNSIQYSLSVENIQN